MTGVAATKVAARSGFFLYMSVGSLVIALIAFSATFFLPLARGTFVAPAVIYVHGALLFAWLIFLVAQASLIRVRSVSLHRRLGWFGGVLGIAVVISGIIVSLHAARRDLVAGGGDIVLGVFVNNLFLMLSFGSLVAAAVVLRRDSESHKRLLLAATTVVLFATWGRLRNFFPNVEVSAVVLFILSYAPLLVAIARDLVAYKRVHPIYVWVAGLLIAVDMTLQLTWQSAAFLRVARWLLGEAAV